MVEHSGRASPAFVVAKRGLPCRFASCRSLFAITGMHDDFALLMVAAADRNRHELEAHGLVFVTREIDRPFPRRARIGANLP